MAQQFLTGFTHCTQEAEEFMKLLGTHQQHGRVFARLAYDSQQVCPFCHITYSYID